ncbi:MULTISPECIES: TetR/AcrR family transcriptional regulator [unclassified Rhodococcus (in: high G+C Gram-positive bacteria)]|uniref:TetR/AcrR family transcriptional regulator n=1 Tax=unclassified Rhodococcus (in: high G+C Gram-positive bacteria) TaxID=192944 RepID=UPI000AEE08A2|nr:MULTISPECIES: TetR/AcrR family transcriptional regulator [unclassified Rhodococcus (in: high G+C Gram-positive bacteria)]
MGRSKQFDPVVAVEQAMQVFWQQGFRATSPQNLVDALGIGRGSLYNTFGSKHGLFELALSRYVDARLRLLTALTEHPDSVKERLCGTLKFMADEGTRGCMIANAEADLAGTDGWRFSRPVDTSSSPRASSGR